MAPAWLSTLTPAAPALPVTRAHLASWAQSLAQQFRARYLSNSDLEDFRADDRQLGFIRQPQPTYGTTKASQPLVRIHVLAAVMNRWAAWASTRNPKFTLTYNLSESESDTVETFLDARGGTEKFILRRQASSSIKVRCACMEQNDDHKGRVELTTTFVQVFEA